MALKSIAVHWGEFSAVILSHPDVSVVQREEMRKAFFGGAIAMAAAMTEMGHSHVSEDEAMQFITDRQLECVAFNAQLLKDLDATLSASVAASFREETD